MTKKQIIILCILSFVVGVGICFVCLWYIFPNWKNIEENVKGESICEVEHCNCPVVEESTGCSIYVDVSGAVKSPGVYCLDEGQRIVDALKKAGGYSKTASLDYIARELNLAQPLADTQKIYIPATKELICELKDFTLKLEEVIPEETTTDNQTTTGDNTAENDSTENSCININTASLEQLDSLNGVGPSTAQKIIDSRPYSQLEDLLNVSGIGQATYDKFKADICL